MSSLPTSQPSCNPPRSASEAPSHGDDPRGILSPEQRSALLLRFPMLAVATDPAPNNREDAIDELARFLREQLDLLEAASRAPTVFDLGEHFSNALMRLSNVADQILALNRAALPPAADQH